MDDRLEEILEDEDVLFEAYEQDEEERQFRGLQPRSFQQFMERNTYREETHTKYVREGFNEDGEPL
jgi:hypothetical protein